MASGPNGRHGLNARSRVEGEYIHAVARAITRVPHTVAGTVVVNHRKREGVINMFVPVS